MPKNAFAGGAPPRTPLGELTALPHTLAGNGGGAPGKGEGKEEEGEGRVGTGGVGRKGEGLFPPNENPGYGLDVT